MAVEQKTTNRLSKEEYEQLIYRDIVDTVDIREGTTLDMDMGSENFWVTVWHRLSENRYAMYSLYYTLFILVLAIIYPILLPTNPISPTAGFTSVGSGSNEYETLKHPLGTDQIGIDILTYIIAGTYTSMIVGLFSTIIFLSIGVPLGLIAGYYGESKENTIMRFTDFFLAIPFLIVAIIAIRLVRGSDSFLGTLSVPIIIFLVLGIFGWAGTTRLVNATTKQVLSEEYISAARTLGASDFRIMAKHILPNIMAPIIVVGTLGIATGILSEAGLTFLGFGDPLSVSWGALINKGVAVLILHPLQTIAPGLAVFFIAIAINLLGDAVRDALDPRLKK